MFGNPNIHQYPAGNPLESQADLYGNSFSNPMNPGNMNQGWGMDPSLMTPSYSANYRHPYSGNNPYGSYGNPGFFRSAANLSPTAEDVPWGNPFMHQQPYINSMSTRPFDAGMWGAQRIAAPVAAFAIANRALGGFRGAYKYGSSFGGGIGRGLATGLGASRGGMIAAGAGRALGAVGGLATGIGLPILGMQALMYGAEKSLFNPYINTRSSAMDLQSNYGGVSFADATGNSVTGGGLGGAESYRMAQGITRQGINDMTFSTGQYAAGASMISRAGLTDNVGAQGINRRIKESMAQVKLIMSIASMPEMRDAIEQLSKLQQSGASVTGGLHSDAAGAMRQIGSMASIAGTTVQRMMSTVGAQGQYLYQANGMTPYLGQLAAAGSYSALAAGNRMGLISSAQLSRMGGLDGATQASLTGQINASQTLYNKMSNFNTYVGKGSSGSLIGNLNQFGASMANDPMGTYGSMMINGRQMAGRQMADRGSMAVEDQIMAIAKNLPGMIDPKTGKLNFERAVPLMMQMGMSEDQIQAFAAQRISETDPGVYTLSSKGAARNLAEQQRQYISQTGAYGGAIGGSIYSARKFGRKVTGAISGAIIDPITSAIGATGDTVQNVTDNLWYGSTVGDKGRGSENIEDLLNSNVARAGSDSYFANPYEGATGMNKNHAKLLTSINSLAKSGDSNANAYLMAKDAGSKKKHLDAMLDSGALGEGAKKNYGSTDYYRGFQSFADSRSRGGGVERVMKFDPLGMPLGYEDADSGAGGSKADAFTDELKKVTGISGNKFDSLSAVGLSTNIAARIARGEITARNVDAMMGKDADLQRLGKLTGKSGMDLLDYAQSTSTKGSSKSLTISGTVAASLKGSDFANSDDALRAVDKITPIHSGGMTNAEDVSKDESSGYAAIEQQYAQAKVKAYNNLKSGRLDFSGYQSTINALDSGKSITQFDTAVEKFVRAVNDMPGTKSTNSGPGFMNRVFGIGDSKKESNNAAGNPGSK